jgi:hypothetical protein
MHAAPVLSLYRRLARWPAGRCCSLAWSASSTLFREHCVTLRGVAAPEKALVESTQAHEWPVQVEVIDAVGETVFSARIVMWISPRHVS